MPITFFFQHLASTAPASALLVEPSTSMVILGEADPAELRTDLGTFCDRLAASELVLFPCVDESADMTRPGSGSHWTLLRWRRGRGFAHVNSMGRGGSNAANARLLATRVYPLLGDAGSGAAVAEAPPLEAQVGGADCGAHMMQEAEAALTALAGGGGGGAPPAVATYRQRVWELARSMPASDAAREWFAARPFPAP
jgi:hypothetical protein